MMRSPDHVLQACLMKPPHRAFGLQTCKRLAHALICLIALFAGGLVMSQPASPESGVEPQRLAKEAIATVDAPEPNDVVIFNRKILTLQTNYLGLSPAMRARRAEAAIAEILALGGPGKVASATAPFGEVITVDGRFAFTVQRGDVDRSRFETDAEAIRDSVLRLSEAIAASEESRDVERMLRSCIRAAIATGLAIALVIAIRRGMRLAEAYLNRFADVSADKLTVGGESFLQRDRVRMLVHRGLSLMQTLARLLVAYEWLGYVLGQFPYTRPWGDHLRTSLVSILARIGLGILSALPSLTVAILIFWLAYLITRISNTFINRASLAPVGALQWLDIETAKPTRRMVTLFVWLFAIAIAYPFLPGSNTDAFKGLSVLVGVMISLGGSSLVGQAASGMVMMFTRTLHVGDYVRINEHEGTVIAVGTFTTRIRTGLGEELSLPNSLVMSNVTRNYSRATAGPGFMIDVTVTIGYDTPWRQVHAMLIQAATATPGVINEPPPRVYQTKLSDFYPEYHLVCQATNTDQHQRIEVLSALHANVQDEFNRNGVQIMSPHYLGDPGSAKIVPESRWYPPRADEASSSDRARSDPMA
jgi:small-conductance mechanosensitive channel